MGMLWFVTTEAEADDISIKFMPNIDYTFILLLNEYG